MRSFLSGHSFVNINLCLYVCRAGPLCRDPVYRMPGSRLKRADFSHINGRNGKYFLVFSNLHKRKIERGYQRLGWLGARTQSNPSNKTELANGLARPHINRPSEMHKKSSRVRKKDPCQSSVRKIIQLKTTLSTLFRTFFIRQKKLRR